MRFHFPEYESTAPQAYVEAVRRLPMEERLATVGRL